MHFYISIQLNIYGLIQFAIQLHIKTRKIKNEISDKVMLLQLFKQMYHHLQNLWSYVSFQSLLN